MPTTTSTWEQVLNDPQLQALPYKIETNERGQLVLSPHKRRHSRLQARITVLLDQHVSGIGTPFVELAVDTTKGTKVADVGWMSDDRYDALPDDVEPTPVAPEICVAVRSDSNTDAELDDKRALYLDAGAVEVWTVDDDGRVRFFDADGERDASALAPSFPASVDV